ncbi:hypothetical protein BBJ28_00014736 [Nothophytophthora sp. Chile5]|nr:hypothetical protein BBJ28_00014736 [Nothophytophthora sp. Chile5]
MAETADGRLANLAAAVLGWSAVWTFCLNAVPAGAKGRNHIVSLNAAHGVVSTATATLTLYWDLDTTNSVAVSLAFFLVDLVAMLHADGFGQLRSLQRSRLMDYGHHVFGVCWGVTLFAHEATVCDASLGNAYVWIQTNEVSTGFYNWWRLTSSTLAGALFASSFFLARIVFNTGYLIPRVAMECDSRYVLGCAPFFALQYVWFAMIVRKLVGGAPVVARTGVLASSIEKGAMASRGRDFQQADDAHEGTAEERQAGAKKHV